VTWDLRLGDCLDPMTGLASLPDKSVDVVITDPPYGAETHAGARGGSGDTKLVTFDSVTAEQLREIFAHFARVARRWVVATVEWRHVLPLEQSPPAGLRFVRHGVWVKPNGAPQFTGDRPAMGWEAVAILHADVDGRMRWNGGGKHAVWTFPKENAEHPTQKPTALLEAFVCDFTDPGELILDPFAGSGTTGVACVRLGRRFLGWERDPKWYAGATRRLRGTKEQLRMFDYRKPTGEAPVQSGGSAVEPGEGEATATPADLPGRKGPAHGVGEAKAGAGESAGLDPGGIGLQRESGMPAPGGANGEGAT